MGAEAVRVAREKAQARNPHDIAEKCGARFTGTAERGEFELPFLGDVVGLCWPELTLVQDPPPVPEHVLALLLYYFALSDGAESCGRLVSFADLPDGRFYVQAFRGYTGAVLVRAFGAAPGKLADTAVALGGVPVDGLGDRAWCFAALPRVPLTLVWWDADDEFEARAEIMFDASASHHLTTDGCAVLGSWLTGLLRR